MRRVRNPYVIPASLDPTGPTMPAPCDSVLMLTMDQLRRASRLGGGLRLNAAQVRALDYAVIRIEGGITKDEWLEQACDAGDPND